jgi:hypothetical protein
MIEDRRTKPLGLKPTPGVLDGPRGAKEAHARASAEGGQKHGKDYKESAKSFPTSEKTSAQLKPVHTHVALAAMSGIGKSTLAAALALSKSTSRDDVSKRTIALVESGKLPVETAAKIVKQVSKAEQPEVLRRISTISKTEGLTSEYGKSAANQILKTFKQEQKQERTIATPSADGTSLGTCCGVVWY